MPWAPRNDPLSCAHYPSLAQCQSANLAFIAFLVQHFSRSNDEYYAALNAPRDDNEYDFVIVGAGAAGCVVANRLSEIMDWKILLLEAGDEEPKISLIPGMMPYVTNSNLDYMYRTQPESHVCGSSLDKTCIWNRGKVMGGSTSINGQWYIRGSRQDFDEWASSGNPGWSYDEVLPYFKKSEDLRVPELLAKHPESHAAGGYLTVGFSSADFMLGNLTSKAWQDLGLPVIDFNTGGSRIGTSRVQTLLVNGARQSANGAFIRPIRAFRHNLSIVVNATVTKIIIDPKTKRAIGVEYMHNGTKKTATATKEVISSAGVVESPKLLMLSGIGPEAELAEANIEVIKSLPVGKNLRDHVLVTVGSFNLTKNLSRLGDLDDLRDDLAYFVSTHEGPLAKVGVADTTAFYRTPYETRCGVPDIQSLVSEGLTNKYYMTRAFYDEMEIRTMLLSSKSVGEIKLNKTDPINSQPVIFGNYLNKTDDVLTLIAGARIARRLFQTKTFIDHGFKPNPLTACEKFTDDSDDYWRCIFKYYGRAALHMVGTCKMGPANDLTSVVDARLKVHGIEGLRVIDAAIMPKIPRGGVMSTTVMIAEKGCDLIKEDWLTSDSYEKDDRLPKLNSEHFLPVGITLKSFWEFVANTGHALTGTCL